jgi:tocopherol O-methyltransferase
VVRHDVACSTCHALPALWPLTVKNGPPRPPPDRAGSDEAPIFADDALPLHHRGAHIHHGYWPTPESEASETKEQAQINLIRLLLQTSQITEGSKVLDVGCGIGGTSRYLASQLGCTVTGITISTKQVEMAMRLTKSEAAKHGASLSDQETDSEGFLKIGKGKVKFVELDAEKMGDVFAPQSESFDVVWICEALSHFPNKQLFFQNAHKSLKIGGKLALADWFKAEGLGEQEFINDIKPIEGV